MRSEGRTMMLFIFFFKQKTAYEMRISDWSSDVCSSDLAAVKDDAEAIANLFAAAPDLFNALEQARAALPDAWAAVKCGVPREVIEIINAALAKAMPEIGRAQV